MVCLKDGFSLDSPKSDPERIWVQDNLRKHCERWEEIPQERVYCWTSYCVDNLYSTPLGIAQEMAWKQLRVVPWMNEEAGELSSHKLPSLLTGWGSLLKHDLPGVSSLPYRQTILCTQRRPSDKEAQEAAGYLLTSSRLRGHSKAPTVFNKDVLPAQKEHDLIGHQLKRSNTNWRQCYDDFHSLPRTSQTRVT